jgi:cytochrome c biogenesis protein CcdA/thiol-disulfide isomerase/thioredoxin
MPLLLIFALLAGAGTAVTPCVLPVLPALLSAGATGGRRRPVGVVVGLGASFTVAVVGLASLVSGVGKAGGATRTLAIVVLALAGALLLVPRVAERLEARLSGLARLGPRSRGTGFWSGVGVGAALGFVYAPCAGPILAAVISVAATEGASVRLVAVALAYAAGSAAVLLLFALGGRRIADRIRAAGRGLALQRALGAVLIATAAVMLANLDVRLETTLAQHAPAVLANPTRALERSGAVSHRLADLRRPSRFAVVERAGAAGMPKLRDLGPAPEFAGGGRWFNSPPLTLAQLRGHVVLIDFWTYTCINCIRTLPQLEAWDRAYRAKGLVIVGIHTPEFSFEHDAGNVARAIRTDGIHYPVVQDNAYATWNAWGNEYWPAEYLIDARGHVRHVHFGEGDYPMTEHAIRTLLADSGQRRLGSEARASVIVPSARATPETYVGADRAQGFARAPAKGVHAYPGPPGNLALNGFALGGTWSITGESATALAGARIDAEVLARDVYLVLSSRGNRPRRVTVELDGRPVPADLAGADVHGGGLEVRGQRLYRLVSLRAEAQHRLTVRLPPGVSAYSFTFG